MTEDAKSSQANDPAGAKAQEDSENVDNVPSTVPQSQSPAVSRPISPPPPLPEPPPCQPATNVAGERSEASAPGSSTADEGVARGLFGAADFGSQYDFGRPETWPEQSPVRWRELVAIVALVALCDIAIYRGQGAAGFAALFFVGPCLLMLGSPEPRFRLGLVLLTGMSWLLAGRIVWQVWACSIPCGFVLLVGAAMALAGLRPYVLDGLAYTVQIPAAGIAGLVHYGRSVGRLGKRRSSVSILSVALPLAAVAVFGAVFVLANPDLASLVGRWCQRAIRAINRWLADFPIDAAEIVFWGAVLLAAVGLLRPLMRRSVLEVLDYAAQPCTAPPSTRDARGCVPTTRSPLFWPWLNTLVAVVVLFAAYLVFEFATLWFRDFPEGFYYAGYAHEGAAWLTVALGLATLVLSIVFRGRLLTDPRLPRLRQLAWLWSVENLVLAAAVYNRLAIYVEFNGMTRMRTVGLFGVSTVVVGFVLVVWKILHQRDFVWLVRRQLWALALAVYLFALTPVDTLVHTYNVRRVMAGDLAPSVQISVHPISSEGVLVLYPLVRSNNETIREGIRAILAEQVERAEHRIRRQYARGWTTYQAADHVLVNHLRAVRDDWAEYAGDRAKRHAAIKRFDDYVYQWY